MSKRMYRAQILLEPEQHKVLVEIADRENRSISDVVREILREYFARRQETVRLERELTALKRLHQIREDGIERYGVYQGDLIADSRAGRDDDFERVWRGEP
jgi:hypothetical protein